MVKGKKKDDHYELVLLPALHPLPLRQDLALSKGRARDNLATLMRDSTRLARKSKSFGNPARPSEQAAPPRNWQRNPDPDELKRHDGQTDLAVAKLLVQGTDEVLQFEAVVNFKYAAFWLHNDTHVCLLPFGETANYYVVETRTGIVTSGTTSTARQRNVTVGLDKVASAKIDKTTIKTDTMPVFLESSSMLRDQGIRQGFVIHEHRATPTECHMTFEARRHFGGERVARTYKFSLVFLRRPLKNECIVWDLGSDHGEIIATSNFPAFSPRRLIVVEVDEQGSLHDLRLEDNPIEAAAPPTATLATQ